MSGRVAAAISLVVLVLLGGLVHREYRTATDELDERRVLGADARWGVAAAREQLAAIVERTAAAEATTAAAIDDVALLEREIGQLGRRLRELRSKLESDQGTLGFTETAVFLTALRAGDIDTCLRAQEAATAAIGAGDRGAAVAALNAAADGCRTALAASSGARFPYDFPDPFVLAVGDDYYGYSTNAGAGDVQLLHSADLLTWEFVGNALAALPAWATPGATWAPSVLPRSDGGYVLYYTARDAASGFQCISSALGATPTGPFVDDSTAPLLCQVEFGGSIDPSPLVDAAGDAWLVWKSERPAVVWSWRLAPDGRSFVGLASQLAAADQPWEAGVVEGPALTRIAGDHYLFYSGGDWSSADYGMAYARCDGPAGPCTKVGAVLETSARVSGPGGGDVFVDRDGRPWLAYHGYVPPDVGWPNSRVLFADPIEIDATGSLALAPG